MIKQYGTLTKIPTEREGGTDGIAERDDVVDSGFAFNLAVDGRTDGRTVKDGDGDDDGDGFDARTRARCGRGRTRECRWTRERRTGDDVDET